MISGVIAVFGVIIGTIAGATIASSGGVFVAKNFAPRKKAAKFQDKAVHSGYSAQKLNRKLIRNYKRQKVALKLGIMPLLETVNHFNYHVNDIDNDFDKVWDATIPGKLWKMIGIAKTEKKIAQLKGKGVQRATRKVDNIISKNGKGPMKKFGWTEGEKVDRSAGAGYVNQVVGYGQENDDGTFDAGVDNECLYQLFATSNREKGYDPNDIFAKSQEEFRKGEESGEFMRFGIDYPTTSHFCADRFVVGAGSSSKMFNIQKLVMLANACAKLAENPDVKKIRIVDESKKGKNRVQIIKRKDVGAYIKEFADSHRGKSAMRALRNLEDCDEQADAIVETIREFVPDFGARRSRSSER